MGRQNQHSECSLQHQNHVSLCGHCLQHHNWKVVCSRRSLHGLGLALVSVRKLSALLVRLTCIPEGCGFHSHRGIVHSTPQGWQRPLSLGSVFRACSFMMLVRLNVRPCSASSQPPTQTTAKHIPAAPSFQPHHSQSPFQPHRPQSPSIITLPLPLPSHMAPRRSSRRRTGARYSSWRRGARSRCPPHTPSSHLRTWRASPARGLASRT